MNTQCISVICTNLYPTNIPILICVHKHNRLDVFILIFIHKGKALGSKEFVKFSTATTGVDDVTVEVNYLYTGDVYIMGNVNSTGWATNNGVLMDHNSDGTYSKTLTLLNSGDGYSYISFTKALATASDDWNAIVNDRFGPKSSGNWELNAATLGQDCDLDTVGAYWSIKMPAGEWVVTINPANNTFKLVPHVPAPVLSLPSGRYFETQTVSITCDNTDATISYSTDGGQTWIPYTAPLTISETTTVMAKAVYGNYESSVTTATYTIRPLDGTDYVLTNAVTVNDEYVLVYSSSSNNYAMSTFNSSNYYSLTTSNTDFELNGTIVTRKTDAVNVLTIESAGNGQYYIVDQAGNYLYYNGSSNVVYTSTTNEGTNDYKWTITFDNDGNAVIQSVSVPERYLQCNAQNSRYACYTSQNNAKLYKRAITEPRLRVTPTTLDLGTVEAGIASVSKTFTVRGYNLTDGVTLSIADDQNFSISPTAITAADLNNGQVTVTVTYTGMAPTATTTVTVTSDNSEVAAQTVTITAARTPLAVTISPADGATFSGSSMSGTISANNPNATIYYSTDGGQTWTQYSDGFTVTASTVGATATVQAYAVITDGSYSETSATETATYTRVAKSSTLFEKVTSTSQLKSGNKYILVYEAQPYALSGTGYTASVSWENGNINIGTSSTTVFTLEVNNGDTALYYMDGETKEYLSHNGKNTEYSTSFNDLTIKPYNQTNYYVTDKSDSYILCYNAGSDPFRWYTSVNGTRAYLYVQGGMIEAPAITPATGTYYESQTVTISDDNDGTTVWYTDDGTDPATSATRKRYNGSFAAPYVAGTTTTIIAVAIDEEDNASEPATVTYTWGVPTAVIAPASGNVMTSSVTVAITGTPADATIYYTIDGTTPTTSSTQYSAPFTVSLPEIGDEVTVQAIAVYNNQSSEIATATYTRVDKVIDVNAPFFSPLQNNTYYGNQTLLIECTTPNADIHYEIIEVDGTTPPEAAYVNNPNNVSTVYTQPINMTVDHSYYVKAIAYIGEFASTIAEGWYVIQPFTGGTYVYQNLKDFNDNCPTGVTATLANPVQVVYHSTYTNNGEYAEFCYLRDNTDYACVYFGKRDTHGYHIFNMGDWIDGSQIAGVTNIWERNFHIQLGTGDHEVSSWPSQAIGWSEILPEEMTNDVIVAGTSDGDNVWGHYVHLRNTTLRDVQDYSANDPKHTGLINDGTADAYYYDKFYRWSAGTCSYSGHNDVINHLGDYDQTFFTTKQNAGATFDVYGIVDYYSQYTPPFEICPIDFLWIYKPVITVPSNDQCDAPFTTTITVTQPEWTDIAPTIYYKTDKMEDWEEYTPGQLIEVNSTTTVMTYAEIPAEKSDGTNYNDYIRSLTETAEYVFPAVADPIITPPGETFDTNVTSSVDVTVATSNESSQGTVTYYTTDGSDPRTSETRIELNSENGTFTVSENTTVQAASCLELNGNTIWSNVVSETYEFIENDGKIYDLLKTVPVVGNIYVIVNKADNVGLSTTQNATNRAATGVMFVDGTKEQVNGNENLATFVLESATAGRYYFRALNSNNYLCVNTNDNPNLVTGARSSYAEAAVTIGANANDVDASYPATIMMSYDGTRRYMRYYSAGRTFTTYDAATTNQDVFLYGLAPFDLLPPSITPGDRLVQVVTGDEHVDADIATNPTSAQDGAKTVYTTDGSDPRYSSTAIEIDGDEIILGYINTNTTVRAASYIEYEGEVIWSEPVKATYTFIGIKEPIITPASGLFVDGTTVNVTVSTNPLNTQDGVTTYYTTDGSDPRTNGTPINGNSTTIPITGNTTVQAASCIEVDGQTLWSIVVSETYQFTTPTPLCIIESEGVKNNDYIVDDELIGTWAVYDGNTKLLWAKDKDPYVANDLRPGKTSKQGDYVRDLLKYQNDPWDESNWVVLDFSGVTMSPEDFVGQKIKSATIVGKYTDDVNFTIKLAKNPEANGTVTDLNYTGWTENFEPVGRYYDRSYNTYVPANFMAEGDDVNNLNRIDQETGFVVGAVAGDFALASCQGDSLYFVNPKIQEVARIWGVWNGNDQFTIYNVGRDTVDNKVTNINAWDLKGCFNVVWDYNRVNLAYEYHKPNHLVPGEAYEFHAVVRKPVSNGSKRTKPTADSSTDASSNYELYPLDMTDDPIPTAVREVIAPKMVIGVSYFNLMGQESSQPFEGINIVVTRYSDGSTSAVKVLR